MSNDLRILLLAQLDTSEKSIKQINSQIKEISKNIDKLNIGIDAGDIEKIQKSIQQMQNQIGKNNKGIKIVDEESAKSLSGLETNIDEILNKYKQLGSVKISKNMDLATKQAKDFTIELEKANGIVERINYEGLKILKEDGSHEYAYRLNTIKEVNNQMKQQEQILQKEHQTRHAINKQQEEKNKKLEHELEIYKRQAQVNVQNLKRQFGNSVSEEGKKELDRYLSNVNALTTNTPDARREMDKLNISFKEISSQVKTASNRVLGFGEQLRVAMSRIPIWMVGMTAFYAPLHGLQLAVETIILLDDQMTSLSRVTNQTKEELQSFFSESIELADQLSTKITDLNEAIIGFSRMGYRGQDLLNMAEAATIMSGVSDLNMEDSMSRIVSAMQIFGIEAEDATDKIVSFMNEIDNNFAISTADLSDGLAKAGATANSFGVDMATTLGHITAIGEASRESGRVIGNSLKTIYSRITTMSASEKILSSIGISIRDVNGEIRDVSDILEELAGKWSNLSSEQQQNLGVTLAGRYQLSRFLLLMQNFHRSQEATAAALNSQNSAQDEYAKYLDSYTARINKMKNAFIELSVSLEKSFLGDALKIGISSIENITKTFSALIDTVGALPLVFGTVAGALGLLHPPTRSLIMSQTQLGLSTAQTGTAMVVTANSAKGMATMYTSAALAAQRLSGATVMLASGVKVLNGAIVGLGRFLAGIALPIAGFMAFGYAISKVIEKISDYQQKQKEIKQQQDEINKSYSENSKEIHNLAREYEILNTRVNNGKLSENSQEYLDVQNKLGELLPILVSHEDERGNKILRNVDAIKQELDYAQKLKENYEQTEIANFENDILKRSEQIKEIQEEISRLQTAQTTGYASYEGSTTNLYAQRDQIANERELQQLLLETNKYVKNKSDLFLSNSGAIQNLTEASQKLITSYIDENNNIKEAIENGENYEDVVKNLVHETTDFGEALSKFNTLIGTGTHVWMHMVDELKKFGLTSDQIYNYVNEYTKKINENTNETILNEEALKELVDTYNNAISSIETLNGFLDELSNGHQLSAKSIGTIVEKYPELLQYMNDETVLIEQIKIKLQEEEKIAKQVILDKLKHNETFFNTLLEQNANYISEVTGLRKEDLQEFKSLAEAKSAIETKLINDLSSKWAKYYNAQENTLSEDGRRLQQSINWYESRGMNIPSELSEAYDAVVKTIRGVRGVSETFDKIAFDEINLGSLNLKSSKSNNSSSSKSDQPSNKDATDALIRQYNLEQELTALDSEKLRTQIELAKSQSDYNRQLELTKQLTQNEQKRISELKQVQSLLHQQANNIRSINKQYDTSKWFDANNNESVSFINQYNKATKTQQEKMMEVFTALQKLKNGYSQANKEILSLNDSTRELTLSNEELLTRLKENLATEVINTYKESYRKQNEIVQDSINQQMKALEKSNQQKLQMYDDELKKFEDTVNGQLRALEDAENEEDFNKQLKGLQDEELKLRQKISTISLDDSIEATTTKKQLEEELQKKLEEIEELQKKRTKDLRKQNLQDMLEEKRNEIQTEKDAAQQLYDINRERLDKEKEYWDRHYENLIEDERRWIEIRRQIMNENVNGIVSEFERLENDIKPHMQLIGESITQNLIDKLKEAGRQLKSLGSGNYSSIGEGSNSNVISKMKANSYAWHSADTAERKRLEAKNQQLGSSIGANYINGKWYKDGIPLYHEGGIVGGKSTRLGKILDEIFNSKNDEMVTKSLVGELQVPPKNFATGIQRMQNLITPKHSSQPNTITIGSLMNVAKIDKDVDINSLTDKIMNTFIDKMKPYGFIR